MPSPPCRAAIWNNNMGVLQNNCNTSMNRKSCCGRNNLSAAQYSQRAAQKCCPFVFTCILCGCVTYPAALGPLMLREQRQSQKQKMCNPSLELPALLLPPHHLESGWFCSLLGVWKESESCPHASPRNTFVEQHVLFTCIPRRSVCNPLPRVPPADFSGSAAGSQ